MERAMAMISTTLIMSEAPLTNALTETAFRHAADDPMMMAISKNHVDASSKYHDPSGTSVRNADQPLDTCSSR